MAIITKDQLEAQRVKFIGVDRDSGELIFNKQTIGAVSGVLIKIDRHTFKHKNRDHPKLDFMLVDGEETYQLGLGEWSWLTFQFLNYMMAIPDLSQPIELRFGKDDDGHYRCFIRQNKRYMKAAYKIEELSFPPKGDVNGREDRRNELIKTWVEYTQKRLSAIAGNGRRTDNPPSMDSEFPTDEDISF